MKYKHLIQTWNCQIFSKYEYMTSIEFCKEPALMAWNKENKNLSILKITYHCNALLGLLLRHKK
jgi:hypothetical protein